MSSDNPKKKSSKKKEVSGDGKKKKPKKATSESTSTQPFNLSFIDRFYQARSTEQSWKEEGQNYVWIKDKKEVCVVGEVTGRNPETNEFTVSTQDGSTHSVPLDSIFPMNPPDYDYCEDMTSLYHLNDLNLFQNIKMRFEKNLVYTFFGNTLLFLNPYQTISKNYSTKKMKRHIGARKDTIEPHIYTVGEKAYFDVVKLSLNQSILLSGESSSGKTENLKHLIEYIGFSSNEEKRSKNLLNALTILESFGNFSTLKNLNSSSFLNLVELNFSKAKFTGSLITCSFINSHRVVFPKNGRNFHIFYQLFSDEDLKQKYNLKEISNYKILNSIIISGLDDEGAFKNLKESAEYLKIPLDEFFDISVAILNLGNLTFNEEDGSINNKEEELKQISNLLQIDQTELEIAIKGKSSMASQELTLKFTEVLYYHTFNRLVKEINQKISSKEKITNYISIVDIPGNQKFNDNYFDQFLVNYSNDKLNHLNNEVFFKKEQEIYVKERIDWKYTDFGVKENYIENESKFLDEIELNEIDKIEKRFLKEEVKTINEKIKIEHFQEKVVYDFDKVWFNANLIQFISNIKSKSVLIDKIVNDMNYKIILTQEIKKKISELWSIMQSTRLQKVLCFVPNEILKPSIIEPKLLLKQIKLNNILQNIKMTRKGYIDHFEHSDFIKRYFMLTSSEFLEEEDELSAQCKLILRNCGFLNTKQYKIGKNLVLLRYSQNFILEELRAERIHEIIIELQAISRYTLARKQLEKLKLENEKKQIEEEEKALNRIGTVKFSRDASTISAISRKQTLSSIMHALKTGKQGPEDDSFLPTSPNQSFRMSSQTIKGTKSFMMDKEKKTTSQASKTNDQQTQVLQENYDRTRKFNADLSSEILELKNRIQDLMNQNEALTKKASKLEEENTEMKAYQDNSKIHDENKSLKEKIIELIKEKEELKNNAPTLTTPRSEDTPVIQTKTLQRKSSLFGTKVTEKLSLDIASAESSGATQTNATSASSTPRLKRSGSLLGALTPRFTLKDPSGDLKNTSEKPQRKLSDQSELRPEKPPRKRRSFTLTGNPLQLKSPEKSPTGESDGNSLKKKPSFSLKLIGKKKSFDSIEKVEQQATPLSFDSVPEISMTPGDSESVTPGTISPVVDNVVDKIFKLMKLKTQEAKLEAITEIEVLLDPKFSEDFEDFFLRKGVQYVFALLDENSILLDTLKLIEKLFNHLETFPRMKRAEHAKLIEILHKKKDENILTIIMNCLLVSAENNKEKFIEVNEFKDEEVEENLKFLISLACTAKTKELNERILRFLTFIVSKHSTKTSIQLFDYEKLFKKLVGNMEFDTELIANESVDLMIKLVQKEKSYKDKLIKHEISPKIKKILMESYVKTNTEFLLLVIDLIPLLYDNEENIKHFDNSLLFPLLNVSKMNQCLRVLKALETLGKMSSVKKEIKSSGKIQIIFSFLAHKNKDFVEHSLKCIYILLLGEEQKNLVFEERHVETIINLMKNGRKTTSKISSLIIEKLCENEKMKNLIVDLGGYSAMKSKVGLQRKPQFSQGVQLSPRGAGKDPVFGSFSPSPISSPRVALSSPLASPRGNMTISDSDLDQGHSPVVSANDLFSPVTVVESKSWVEQENEKLESNGSSSPSANVIPSVSYSDMASGLEQNIIPKINPLIPKGITASGVIGPMINIPKIQLKETDDFSPPKVHSPLFQEYLEKEKLKKKQEEEQEIVLKIHVGNLNFKTKEKDLTKKFCKFGKVISCEIAQKNQNNNKKSQGYAVIEMKKTEAEKAISALNKTDILGRKIYCKAIQF
eukprot:gene9504-1710_t